MAMDFPCVFMPKPLKQIRSSLTRDYLRPFFFFGGGDHAMGPVPTLEKSKNKKQNLNLMSHLKDPQLCPHDTGCKEATGTIFYSLWYDLAVSQRPSALDET